jgi:glycosyltransferase involved in cell wall biosynthesis
VTYRGATVGVVVPAYEEAGFVGDVIETVPDYVDRVYAVDDASTDGTWGEMQAAAARVNVARPPPPGFDRRVVTVRRAENGGVGAALKTGYARAREDGLDAVAVMNGDGQMDPAHLGRILDPVVSGEAAYAKGNRLVHRDHRESMSRWRLFGNALLSGLTKVATGYWGLTDPQNGYTAIDGETLRALALEALYDEYGFCNHLLAHLHRRGARVADVALPAVYGDERSHIRYRTFVPRLSALLARSFLSRLRDDAAAGAVHPPLYLLAAGAGTGAGALAVVAAYGAGRLAGVALAAGAVALVAGSLALAADARAAGGLTVPRYDRPGGDGHDPSPRPPADRLREAGADSRR